jgi:phosphoglucomutase/phosphomannomutase
MERMKALMSRFRQDAPQSLGGMAVARVRDYQSNLAIEAGGRPKPLRGPTGDMVMFDLATEGNYVAVRPSGTEPIVKFYTFAYQPPAEVHDVEASRAYLASRLEAVEKDLKAAADVG